MALNVHVADPHPTGSVKTRRREGRTCLMAPEAFATACYDRAKRQSDSFLMQAWPIVLCRAQHKVEGTLGYQLYYKKT
jgi:hypothetical protein